MRRYGPVGGGGGVCPLSRGIGVWWRPRRAHRDGGGGRWGVPVLDRHWAVLGAIKTA